MNAIRIAMSVFLLALLGLSIAGWIWAGGQPVANAAGARAVLAVCGLTSIGSLWLLWTFKRPSASEGGSS